MIDWRMPLYIYIEFIEINKHKMKLQIYIQQLLLRMNISKWNELKQFNLSSHYIGKNWKCNNIISYTKQIVKITVIIRNIK